MWILLWLFPRNIYLALLYRVCESLSMCLLYRVSLLLVWHILDQRALMKMIIMSQSETKKKREKRKKNWVCRLPWCFVQKNLGILYASADDNGEHHTKGTHCFLFPNAFFFLTFAFPLKIKYVCIICSGARRYTVFWLSRAFFGWNEVISRKKALLCLYNFSHLLFSVWVYVCAPHDRSIR